MVPRPIIGSEAAARVKEGEQSKRFMFFAVGVQGANFETLAQISVREPLKLQRLKFRDPARRKCSPRKSGGSRRLGRGRLMSYMEWRFPCLWKSSSVVGWSSGPIERKMRPQRMGVPGPQGCREAVWSPRAS